MFVRFWFPWHFHLLWYHASEMQLKVLSANATFLPVNKWKSWILNQNELKYFQSIFIMEKSDQKLLEHCWQWIEGDLVFLSHWRWNVWGKSDFWASIQEKWFEAAPENWRELKFFSFYQTCFPPTPNHWFYLGRGKAKFRMWAKLTKTIPV